MAKKCKNCGQEMLKVAREDVVRLRVFCENCGEVQGKRDYTHEQEFHDQHYKGKRDQDKYTP